MTGRTTSQKLYGDRIENRIGPKRQDRIQVPVFKKKKQQQGLGNQGRKEKKREGVRPLKKRIKLGDWGEEMEENHNSRNRKENWTSSSLHESAQVGKKKKRTSTQRKREKESAPDLEVSGS